MAMYSETNSLEESKKFLHDTKTQDLQIIKKKNSVALNNKRHLQLGRLKEKFHSLKEQAQEKEMFLLFLEGLCNEKWPIAKEADITLKEASAGIKQVKEDLYSTKSNLEDVIDVAEKLHTSLQEQTAVLEERIGSLEKKLERYKHLQQKNKAMRIEAEKSRAEVVSLKECLKTGESMVKYGEERIASLRVEVEELRRSKDDLAMVNSHAVLNNVDMMHKQITLLKNKIDWFASMTDTISTLGGVRETELNLSEMSLTLLILPETHQADRNLYLKLYFRLDHSRLCVLKNVEVSLPSFNFTEVIQTATEDNDISFLINRVQSTWRENLPVYMEITDLQEKYAIDWIPDARLVKFMTGDGGRVIISLTYDISYPSFGLVTVQNISGLSKDMDLSSIKPEKEAATLSDWLQYLDENFRDSSNQEQYME